MNLSEMLKEPVVSVLERLKLALWVEVVTEQPNAPTTLDLLYVQSAQKPLRATLNLKIRT